MFELRREQMKMQQESLEAKLRTGIKERQFFYPATFETLEAILRNNFTSVFNIEDDQRQQHHRHARVHEVKFFTNSALANEAFNGKCNDFSLNRLLHCIDGRSRSPSGHKRRFCI